MTCSTLQRVKFALRYAELGWAVLPLEPKKKLPIGRLAPNGVINATTDESTIRIWLNSVPSANIGISCERLLIVDVDPRNGGVAALDAAVSPFGGMPLCPIVSTGGGGTHYFFTRPEGDELRGKLCPGVDLVHGRNRYVVAAPSVHPSGGIYRWTSPKGITVGPPPEWLLRLARRPPPTPLPPRTTGGDALERARRYLAKCDPAVSGAGGQNHTFKVCRFLVERFELAEGDALAALTEWNARCSPPWSPHELHRKLRHALAKSSP